MSRTRIDERGLFVKKLLPEDSLHEARGELQLRGCALYRMGVLQARFNTPEDARRVLPEVPYVAI